eukprot:scaffold625_cov324-Pavlova_lutheri.AAC.80
MKSDHFPGCQNKLLVPAIEGSPNFRKVDGLPVYGVAIPTLDGLKRLLRYLGADKGKRIVWHNLREEPVLYINGRPFVLREADRPFSNIEYTGINRERVEGMEERLKSDVLAEAYYYGGSFLLADETSDGRVVDVWETIEEGGVLTSKEVYQHCAVEGLRVDYLRVPITDEKAPVERDIDTLTRRASQFSNDSCFVFNCQMGRGRTTTGMVIACLVQAREMRDAGMVLPFHATSVAEVRTEMEALKAGEFGVVRSLLRVLDSGNEGKLMLDAVIDACDAMQNLRESILNYRSSILTARGEDRRNLALGRTLEYLQRYYVLVAFSSYVLSSQYKKLSFEEWMQSRPELYSVLQRMLRRNPSAALSLHEVSTTTVEQSSPDMGHEMMEDGMDGTDTARTGAVLGPGTILKEDHFPGCQTWRLEQHIAGAPNFRHIQVADATICGVGIPSLEGARSVLRSIGIIPVEKHENIAVVTDGPAEQGNGKEKAIWHNMREEPVVYIKGGPYVLREESRPFKNLQEYSGIEVGRLERMEERLKADVLSEAQRRGGFVSVERELEGGELQTIPISVKPEDVLTAKEVFGQLAVEGFPVDYIRIPVTDGHPPKPKDFDALLMGVSLTDPSTALIFSCQMGYGRTTTGMVIGSLLKLRQKGMLAQNLRDVQRQGEETVSRKKKLRHTVARTPEIKNNMVLDEESSSDHYMSDDSDAAETSDKENVRELVALRNGDYAAIRRLVRLFVAGLKMKEVVDAVINHCAAITNLREAILAYRRPRRHWGPSWTSPSAAAAAVAKKDHRSSSTPSRQVAREAEDEFRRAAAFTRGTLALQRYALIIAFAAFLDSSSYAGGVGSFKTWIHERPEIREVMRSIHKQPAAALAAPPKAGLALSLPPSRRRRQDASPSIGQACSSQDALALLASRQGAILAAGSILKHYGLPLGSLQMRSITSSTLKQQNMCPSIPQQALETRPCGLSLAGGQLPIGSAMTCAVPEMRAMLSMLGASPPLKLRIRVADLREELVVYCGGQSHVLREADAPVSSLRPAGIQPNQIASMERLLQADVLGEAARGQSRVLLHREIELKRRRISFSDGHEDVTSHFDAKPSATVVPYWFYVSPRNLSAEEGIATPVDVFSSLASEGYAVDYSRLPLSRERMVSADDIDKLHTLLESVAHAWTKPDGFKEMVLFISHTGRGSSIRFSMATACVALPMMGVPESELSPALTMSTSPSDHKMAEGDEELLRGEYRVINALVRVLAAGPATKAAVDLAINRCSEVGNIRQDIFRCRQTVATAQTLKYDGFQDDVATAQQIGSHYLERYFHLICYRAYLGDGANQQGISYSDWFEARPELEHLLSNLELE